MVLFRAYISGRLKFFSPLIQLSYAHISGSLPVSRYCPLSPCLWLSLLWSCCGLSCFPGSASTHLWQRLKTCCASLPCPCLEHHVEDPKSSYTRFCAQKERAFSQRLGCNRLPLPLPFLSRKSGCNQLWLLLLFFSLRTGCSKLRS